MLSTSKIFPLVQCLEVSRQQMTQVFLYTDSKKINPTLLVITYSIRLGTLTMNTHCPTHSASYDICINENNTTSFLSRMNTGYQVLNTKFVKLELYNFGIGLVISLDIVILIIKDYSYNLY